MKVQLIGDKLDRLKKSLEALNIEIDNERGFILAASILSMAGPKDEKDIEDTLFRPPYDARTFARGFLLSLLKNAESVLTKDEAKYEKDFVLHPKGIRVSNYNEAEYLIISNDTLFYPLYKKGDVLYSKVWPENKFTKKLEEDVDVEKIRFPFAEIDWKEYYRKFVELILKNFDKDHIILYRSNYSQYYIADGTIASFGKCEAHRDFIQKADDYFYELTKCKCINDTFSFIPNEKKTNLFAQGNLGKSAGERAAESFFKITEGVGEALPIRFKNSLTQKLHPLISEEKIISENEIENELFDDAADINDLISVYLALGKDGEGTFKAFEKLMENKCCYPAERSMELFEKNCSFLSTYKFIADGLKEELHYKDKLYIPFTDTMSFYVDYEKGKVEIKNIEFNNADSAKVSSSGGRCLYNEAESVADDPDIYIMKMSKSSEWQKLSICYPSENDFYESLFYINYERLLKKEEFFLVKQIIEPFDTESDDRYDTQVFFERQRYKQKLFELYKEKDVNDDIKGKIWNKRQIDTVKEAELDYYREFGRLLYEKNIKNEKDTYYFVMGKSALSPLHLGDLVRIIPYITLFKYFYAWRKKININKIKVFTTQRFEDLVKTSEDVDEVTVLSDEEIHALCTYATVNTGCENLIASAFKLKVTWGSPNMLELCRVPEAFLVKYDHLLRFPSRLSKESYDKAWDIFRENGDVPEKTIIIFPYAQTSGNLQFEYWEDMISYYKDRGYSVYTNVGLNEESFKGTKPIDATADVVLAMGALGSIFVGVQSGFMDAAVWLNVLFKVILIYPLNCREAIRLFLGDGRTLVRSYAPHSIDKKIEWRKASVCSVAITSEEEKNNLSKKVIEQTEYFIKGNLQASKNVEPYEGLKQADNLNDYIEELTKADDVVILMSVCDSSDRQWGRFHAREKLGLKEDLSDKKRWGYLAVADLSEKTCYENLKERLSDVEYEFEIFDTGDLGTLDGGSNIPQDNKCYLYSYPYDDIKRTQSQIVINGVDYSKNKRGLNIVVYSKKLCCVIDSINVDTFGDESLSIRR